VGVSILSSRSFGESFLWRLRSGSHLLLLADPRFLKDMGLEASPERQGC